MKKYTDLKSVQSYAFIIISWGLLVCSFSDIIYVWNKKKDIYEHSNLKFGFSWKATLKTVFWWHVNNEHRVVKAKRSLWQRFPLVCLYSESGCRRGFDDSDGISVWSTADAQTSKRPSWS